MDALDTNAYPPGFVNMLPIDAVPKPAARNANSERKMSLCTVGVAIWWGERIGGRVLHNRY